MPCSRSPPPSASASCSVATGTTWSACWRATPRPRERTREVGIRRAVGAARKDIAAQFLVESSLLTSAGGVLGAVLGVAGSFAIQALAGWPTALSVGMLVAGLLVALGVGIRFGFYPA